MNNFTGNMRPGQKNRGRGGRGMGGGGYNPNRQGGGGGGGRPPHRNQNFDSSGPSVKIRGNAYQVFERYIAMAREAASAGDRVAAENLYQHAEHYYRIMQANGEGQQQQGQRPMTPADTEMAAGHDEAGQPGAPPPGMQPQPQPQPQYQPPQQHQQQQQSQPQPQQHQPQRPQQSPAPAPSAPQPPAPPSETEY